VWHWEQFSPAWPAVSANVVWLKVLGRQAAVVWHCSQLCEKARAA
jgi:hypothetical protein